MIQSTISAELAQSVERTTLNRVVEGSIPSFGAPVFWVIGTHINFLIFCFTTRLRS